MATTSTPIRRPLPLVRAEDVRIGTYMADVVHGRLLYIVDLRLMPPYGPPPRMAMLEDAMTEEIEPWEIGQLATLRLVRPAAVSETKWGVSETGG